MKKLFLLLICALIGWTSNVSAQTDVTSTYITNADFSSTDGWTAYVSSSFKDYGNGLIGTYGVRTAEGQAVSTVDATHLSTEYCFGFECRWKTNYASYNQTTSSLEAGCYTLTFDVENTNSSTTSATYNNLFYVKVGDTTYSDTYTEWMSGGSSWTTHTISFTLTEAATATISLGYGTGSNNIGSTYTPTLHVSHLKLTYLSFADAYAAAVSAASTTIADETYANVIGTEKSDLQTLIDQDASEFTTDDYIQGISDIETAEEAFIAAVDNYDALVAEITKAKALGIDETTADSYAATSESTSATALTSTQALKVAEFNYVKETYGYSVELGTWTASSGTGSLTGQHWDGTTTSSYLEQSSANWSASSWSISYDQDVTLPAGNYIFKVAGRKAASDGVTLSLNVTNGETSLGSISDFPEGDTGLGISVNGTTTYSADSTYANSNAGRGWEWRYVKFTLTEDATVNVAINGVATTNHMWVSFCNATVQTDDEANISLIAYNIALASANTVLADETYTNVTGAEKTALQAAIAADDDLDKTDADAIDAATTTLTEATDAFTAAVTNYDALATAITSASAIVTAAANVGDGVFQIPTSAQTTLSEAVTTAQTTASSFETTSETAGTAATTLNTAVDTYSATTLNVPDADTHYNIVVATSEHALEGNAVVAALGSTSTNNPTGYTFKATAAPATYLAQAVTFTQVEGNNYYISFETAEGTVYLTYGTTNGSAASWSDSQIQGTTDEDNKGTFLIAASSTDGAFNIYNTLTSSTIACQSGGALYTESGNADFSLSETSKATVNVTIDAAVQYGTRVFPFAPTLPDGVTAYSCAEETDGVLTLEEVTTPAANVPYILYAESGCTSTDLTGWGTASTTSYTSGLLTGVYAETTATAGTYVLQNNDSKVGFYLVAEGSEPTIGANRCYLTAAAEGRAAYFFGDDSQTTGINAINALTSGDATFYDANGRQTNKLQKGLNIVNANGKTYKMVVK